MKRFFLLAALLTPAVAHGQATPIDLTYARTYFDELRALGRADGGELWGVPIDGPMLFADAATHTVVANMPDTQGQLHEQSGVWMGVLPADQNVANTAVTWAGRRWSMVMWPVTDGRYARRRLLMHESFHRVQDTLGLPASDVANAHLATADGRIWTRLEWRALTEALLRTGDARNEALRDALTFRARRRSLFKDAADEERRLELNEGLAEYTGYVLSGLPRSALNDRVAIQLAQYEQQDNFARSFAYASGPAYALLLDAAGKPWRGTLGGTSDLSAMAASAYAIAIIEPEHADARSAQYTGARMIAEERAKESARVAKAAALRAKVVDGPTLTLPVAGAFNYSFDPNAATPLPDIGTVFDHARVTDEWGVLEVASGGVLMRRTNGLITAIVVPTPLVAGPTPKGDGWTLQLNPGWLLKPGARAGDWIVSKQ